MPKPDFSGRWRFDPSKSRLQIAPPDSTEFVVEHREPALHLSRTHVMGGKSDTFAIDLTTDGREVEAERDGVQMHLRAQWDGDTLVFDTKLIRGAEEATNVVRYTLASDGMTLRTDERFRSLSLNYDNLWVLERVGALNP